MAIKIIHGDAAKQQIKADMIVTDPPFDMDGQTLATILAGYDADHLLLMCSMRQLLEFSKCQTRYKFGFDLVLDIVSSKQSKSLQQPNYTHVIVVYFYRGKSAFNRNRGERSDVFTKGFFPTIVRSPSERRQQHGQAKNQQALQDLISFFNVSSVVDPFAGSGTTAMACSELDIECTLVEQDALLCTQIVKNCQFLGVKYVHAD